MGDEPTPSPSLELPAPHRVLARTDWAALRHAYGPATDAPEMLGALLHADQSVRTRALDDVHGILHHQNTIYEATVPAARYVTAVLSDPRTLLPVDKARRAFAGCMRAELLMWIASVADSVRGAGGSDDYPPAVAMRGMRPLMFSAASAYVDDIDRHVGEAALAACIPLVDDASLVHHRAALVPSVREILGTSDLWQHRERAIDALDDWDEDSSGLEGQRNPFLFCDTDPSPDDFPWHPGSREGRDEGLPF
ncbi:hypothetical protein ACFWBR_26460 [Streptomyces sp. NPDC060006]|uniref:hypothetical protein n=1 Tax=unclassified Streptomyces TaxID=2593676 RepID=UPI0036D0F669